LVFHFKEFNLETGLPTGEAESYVGETLLEARKACLATHRLRNPKACLGDRRFAVIYPAGKEGGRMLTAIDPFSHRPLLVPPTPLVVLASA